VRVLRVQLGTIRTAVVGILTLHTLPTRETLAIVQLLQVVLGSLALAAGGIAGSTSLHGASYVYGERRGCPARMRAAAIPCMPGCAALCPCTSGV
jgi:hypothetical protein